MRSKARQKFQFLFVISGDDAKITCVSLLRQQVSVSAEPASEADNVQNAPRTHTETP